MLKMASFIFEGKENSTAKEGRKAEGRTIERSE
jgi:hypothetical protein